MVGVVGSMVSGRGRRRSIRLLVGATSAGVVACLVATPVSASPAAAPDAPSSLTIGGKPCVEGAVTRMGAQSAAPAMSALVTDPDGGTVRGRFRWQVGTSVTSTAATVLSGYVASGSRASVALPVELVDGTMPSGTWSFRVVGENTDGRRGASSEKCTFTIDSTRPSTPRVAGNDRWPVGEPQTVTIRPAVGNATEVAGYAYSIDSDQAPADKTVLPNRPGKVLTLTWPDADRPAPPVGLHVLRVWAYDAAGNRSARAAPLTFEVVGPPSSRATYEFDGTDEVAGRDSTGPYAMSLGTAARVNRVIVREGDDVFFRDTMLSLTPSTTTLPSVTAPLLAMSRSFSIAGFFDPARLATPRAMTAVTVRGGDGAKFAELGVAPSGTGYEYVFKVWDPSESRWDAVRLPGEDRVPGTSLVVATYDPDARTLELSMPDRGFGTGRSVVNGAPTTLDGQQLLLGASTTGGSRWKGGIDNLVIASGALNESEIGDLVSQHEREECFGTEYGCD